jgi:putative drug exporter of the RND superfamily
VTSRRWLVPALLLLAWLAIAGVGGPLSGKLSQVQKNNTSDFLPKDAESAQVAVLQQKFATASTFPAFVLLEGDTALTAAQLQSFGAWAQTIPGLSVTVKDRPAVTVGDFLVAGPVPVIPSQDGKAAFAVVNFDLKDLGATLADGKSPIQRSVETIRDADKGQAVAGVRVYVAGPAGVIADLVKAFGGIDGILLLVAGITVLVILLVVYRSPFLPFFVILSAAFAYVLAGLLVYLLAKNDVITVDGQGQGILSILVIGAATDYALLLVARYREELRHNDNHYQAMQVAWRRAVEPIVASGSTVILGLLCLLLSNLGPTKGLGPVGAIGIACAMLAALTFLPALLVVGNGFGKGAHGRWVFWPAMPVLGSADAGTQGIWKRVSNLVGTHPRRVWTLTALALLVLAAFLPTLRSSGVKQSDSFLTTVESVTGGDEIAKHFPGGSGNPGIVIGPAVKADAMLAAAKATPGVSGATWTTDVPAAAAGGAAAAAAAAVPPKVVEGLVELQVTFTDPADSLPAGETVKTLRTNLDAVDPGVKVGGSTATNVDVRAISARDRNVIIPAILVVIFVVLMLLLRSVVAPLLLIVANVLSFAATMGVSAIAFNHIFHFPGSDATIALYGFVFLVALGIDYSIFLMTRVREESLARGTRDGVLTGLSVTGGVITSAGLVLAATFAALGVLPLLFLVQIAFVVAFGVLLDTLIVRSLLVPALSIEIGRRIWWPGKLAQGD